MGKTHFTKSPWMAVRVPEYGAYGPSLVWRVVDARGIKIACTSRELSSPRVLKAAAISMAAAPERQNLLERIKAQLEFAEQEREIDVELEHRIDKVLAKARGEVKNEQKK